MQLVKKHSDLVQMYMKAEEGYRVYYLPFRIWAGPLSYFLVHIKMWELCIVQVVVLLSLCTLAALCIFNQTGALQIIKRIVHNEQIYRLPFGRWF